MEQNIFKLIINTMVLAQQNKLPDKKTFVLNAMSDVLGEEAFERYKPLISLSIDLLKDISKNKNILKDLKNNNCFSSCIK